MFKMSNKSTSQLVIIGQVMTLYFFVIDNSWCKRRGCMRPESLSQESRGSKLSFVQMKSCPQRLLAKISPTIFDKFFRKRVHFCTYIFKSF